MFEPLKAHWNQTVLTPLDNDALDSLGWAFGECHWLVPQSPRLRMLVIGHRCQHSDAQPAVSGTLCGRCGKKT